MTTATVANALDEHVNDARSRLGRLVTIDTSGTTYFNEEATRDTIKHYAWAVSDMNPLWLDEEYARRSRFGAIVAPPTFPYSIVLPSMGRWQVKFDPAVRWTTLYGGTTWDFYHTIHIGERFHATAKLIDVQIKESKTVGRMGVLTSEVKYWNQDDVLVAKTICPHLVYPARTASAPIQQRETTAPARGELAVELLEQQVVRRGEEPLYWEDVTEGSALPDLPKGRLRTTDITRWNAGCYGPLFLVNKLTKSGEHVGGGHYDAELAQSAGLPGAYDNGPLRGGWLSELIANWMGDWGDLLHLEYSLRLLNVVGDINTIKGKVRAKRQSDGESLVDLDVWVENERGQITAPGRATVRLPSKHD